MRVSRQMLRCGIDYNVVGAKQRSRKGIRVIKQLAMAVAWILVSAAAAAANNAPASDASIREMLDLTNAQQMIAGMKGQMSTIMNNAMRNAMQGQNVTPEKQAILDRMTAKMSAAATDVLNWGLAE